MTTFGEQLRKWRLERKVNQRDLANKVGMDFTYLSKLENGRMPPPSEAMIQAIGRALEKEPELDVLFRLAEKVPEDLKPIITGSREAPALLRAINGLSDAEVRKLTRLAENYKRGESAALGPDEA